MEHTHHRTAGRFDGVALPSSKIHVRVSDERGRRHE